MSFLISVIDGHDVYVAAPVSKLGYSHLLKEDKHILACINDDRVLFDLHTKKLTIASPITFKSLKTAIMPNIPEGYHDIVIATNEIIYHVDHEGNVIVNTSYLAIGSNSSVIYGALFATEHLGMDPKDRIEIALKAIDVLEYELVGI